jgi:hypothetical protein
MVGTRYQSDEYAALMHCDGDEKLDVFIVYDDATTSFGNVEDAFRS